MKLNEEMFAIKLYELEQQYRTMQSRIRLCGRLDGPELEQELARARQENLLAIAADNTIESTTLPVGGKFAAQFMREGLTVAHLDGQLTVHGLTDFDAAAFILENEV